MIHMQALDDKSYGEIFREALAAIPVLTDEWTDFNPQDTGVMLLELCAALTEMQNYYLDQVDERYYRRFFKLLMNADSQEGINNLFQAFALRNNKMDRAITTQDYRHILLTQHPELRLDDAYIEFDDKIARVYVLRKDGSLSYEELMHIRACLERYRLLTVRLQIEQMPYHGLEIEQ